MAILLIMMFICVIIGIYWSDKTITGQLLAVTGLVALGSGLLLL